MMEMKHKAQFFNMGTIITGMIAGALAVFVMQWQVVVNIAKPLRQWDDITWQYFLFDNNLKKISRGDFEDFFDARMFYPRKNTLAFGNSMLGQSLLALPVYLVTKDVATAANSVILVQLWLAFVAMYLLAYRLTKNVGGGLVAGMIYSFNPYVMAHLHHEQLALGWLPLLFLVRRSWVWGAVWLMLLVSSFYYTLFALVTVPIYMMLQKRISKSLIGVSLLVAIIGWIYLQPFREVKKAYNVNRSPALVALLAAKPNDWLFTGRENWLYGRWAKSPLRDGFAREHPTEHSLFPGLTTVVLALIGLKNRRSRVWLIILGISVVLSMWPMSAYGNLGIRAVSRWWVIGMMALACLASYVNYKKVVLGIVLLLLAVEYRQVGWVKPFEIKPEIRQFYSWLDKQEEVKVMVELPIANDLNNSPSFERSAYDDGQYLLYALGHDKKLVNGHHSFIPEDAYVLGRELTTRFPTEEKIRRLRSLGVDMVVVHREEYRQPQVGEAVLTGLRELGLLEVYGGETISAFRL